MGTKVEVRTIPLHGLFIHRKQVWRSLGKLRAESHSTDVFGRYGIVKALYGKQVSFLMLISMVLLQWVCL